MGAVLRCSITCVLQKYFTSTCRHLETIALIVGNHHYLLNNISLRTYFQLFKNKNKTDKPQINVCTYYNTWGDYNQLAYHQIRILASWQLLKGFKMLGKNKSLTSSRFLIHEVSSVGQDRVNQPMLQITITSRSSLARGL